MCLFLIITIIKVFYEDTFDIQILNMNSRAVTNNKNVVLFSCMQQHPFKTMILFWYRKNRCNFIRQQTTTATTTKNNKNNTILKCILHCANNLFFYHLYWVFGKYNNWLLVALLLIKYFAFNDLHLYTL
jgi:hypothetical protein